MLGLQNAAGVGKTEVSPPRWYDDVELLEETLDLSADLGPGHARDVIGDLGHQLAGHLGGDAEFAERRVDSIGVLNRVGAPHPRL